MPNGLNVQRLTPSEAALWVRAVDCLVPSDDRDDELLSVEEARAALADERCYLLVATLEQDPIGLLSAYRFPDVECGGHLVYLYDIEVQTAQRRRGVGRALVEALKHLSNDDDVDMLWAGTERDNSAARITFERTGARLVGEQYVEYEWDLD